MALISPSYLIRCFLEGKVHFKKWPGILGTLHFGGFLIDLEQAHPGHLKNGKTFYFASGLGLVGGTICDFLAKMLPYYRKALVPMSLCIDGIGRYLLRMSHNRGELSKPNPKPNLQMAV